MFHMLIYVYSQLDRMSLVMMLFYCWIIKSVVQFRFFLLYSLYLKDRNIITSPVWLRIIKKKWVLFSNIALIEPRENRRSSELRAAELNSSCWVRKKYSFVSFAFTSFAWSWIEKIEKTFSSASVPLDLILQGKGGSTSTSLTELVSDLNPSLPFILSSTVYSDRWKHANSNIWACLGTEWWQKTMKTNRKTRSHPIWCCIRYFKLIFLYIFRDWYH